MNFLDFLRLLHKNLRWMLLAGILTAATVYSLTRQEKKVYSSHTVINTGLVSGYNLERSSSSRIDYAFTNNELENLIGLAHSRETLEELGAQFLAECLLMPQEKISLLPENYQELKEALPGGLWEALAAKKEMPAIVAQLEDLREAPGENPVKTLLLSKNELVGIEHLNSIVVRREGNSDMIRIGYATKDPWACRRTIEMLTGIFIEKHRLIKEGQSNNVLEFFEKATQESADDLRKREDALLGFMVENKIINYYEQTRFIAAKKEDLDELYYKELMRLAAADSTRQQLENRLESQVALPQIHQQLMSQRQSLAESAALMAQIQVAQLQDSLQTAPVEVTQLQYKIDRLKTDMHQSAVANFNLTRSPDGLATKQLLERWLEQWMDVEQTLARVKVLKDRKQDFDRIYSRFAPWGSKLKRLEREIEVAEKAYLENLHSFNQARLHRYNTMMSSDLRVVDAPFRPDKPEPSKRMMLVVLAFVIGNVLILALFVALDLLDQTLREPERAVETTGLRLATAFPFLPDHPARYKRLDYSGICRKAVNQLHQRMSLDLRHLETDTKNPLIVLTSMRPSEGKSRIGEMLVQQLRQEGKQVRFWQPAAEQGPAQSRGDFAYDSISNLEKQIRQFGPEEGESVLHLVELPAVLEHGFPQNLIEKADLTLMVASAKRTWNLADQRQLLLLQEIQQSPIRLVLNQVQPDQLESSLGEIPKQRSWLRSRLKKLLARRLSVAAQ